MRYESEQSGASTTSIVMGVAILLLLIVGGGGFVYLQHTEGAERLDRQYIAKELLRSPADGKLMRELKKFHPAEFDRFVDYIAELRRKGVREQEVVFEGRKLLASMVFEMKKSLQQAPADDLARYRKAKIGQLEKESVETCERFIVKAGSLEETPSPEMQAALMNMTTALFQAAAGARDKPVKRALSPKLSEKDRIALSSAMRKQGLSETELVLFSDERRLKMATARQRCSVDNALWRATDSLDAGSAERVTAMLVRV